MNRAVDDRVIERALQGDVRAFEDVYLSLRGIVYNFAYRMLGTRSAAEDITQEVFIFLIQRPDKYLPERGSLKAFLCGIARNKILHHLRNGHKSKKTETLIDDCVALRDEIAGDPLTILLDKEVACEVERSFALLPAPQREAIILRELQGLSYEEIGTIVGENINTVKSRVRRARLSLGASLAPYVGRERKQLS